MGCATDSLKRAHSCVTLTGKQKPFRLGTGMLHSFPDLAKEESAYLVVSVLSKTWPSVDFSIAMDRASLTVSWTDGPWEEDVYKLISTYVSRPNISEWANALILALPDGSIKTVLPVIDLVITDRSISPRFAQEITTALAEYGCELDISVVLNVLQGNDKTHPQALKILAESNRIAAPLPHQIGERSYINITPEDAAVIQLCKLLDQWRQNPHSFTYEEFETVQEALRNIELRAVISSMLFEEKPVPGEIANLIEIVVNDCLYAQDHTTAELGLRLLNSAFPSVNISQQELNNTTNPENTMLNEMGYFLRKILTEV